MLRTPDRGGVRFLYDVWGLEIPASGRAVRIFVDGLIEAFLD